MTGLHATHMIIGEGVLAILTFFAWRGKFTNGYSNPIEVAGLYWHFVDVVWIFLFPHAVSLRRPLMHQELDKSTLVRVALGLFGLLVLTVGFSFVNLGPLNFVVALGIAVLKALLVVLFFMEVRWSSQMIWVFAAAGIVWLVLLIGGTLTDVVSRIPPHLPPY